MSDISYKTVIKLTENRENPKCDAKSSKNLQNYSENLSKSKMYLKSDMNHFKTVTQV